MLHDKYAYLLADQVFLMIWSIIFLSRQDLRKQMLLVGGLLVIPGVLLEYFVWTMDWWSPMTITNTRAGIEDVLLAFLTGGIGTALYEFAAKKSTTTNTRGLINNRLIILLIFPLIYLILFFLLDIHSFFLSVIIFCAALIQIFLFRSDLIVPSIVNGLLLLLIVLPVFRLLLLIFPDIVGMFWMLENLSGYYLLGFPLEEFVFYFLTGMFLGIAFEFIYDLRFIDLK